MRMGLAKVSERASTGARVPLLADAEAWKRLPPVESGGGQPLPSWARALAGPLPYTTAAMLELDRAYRTSDSLDPKLAAAIRLVVARTVRSEYGIACAHVRPETTGPGPAGNRSFHRRRHHRRPAQTTPPSRLPGA